MPKTPDYYSILQVKRRARPETIEAAFRRLSKTHGPGASRRRKESVRYREIKEAYEVLRDKKSRVRYNKMLASTAKGEPARAVEGRALSSRNYLWLGAGGVGAVAILGVLLLIVLSGGGDRGAVAQLSPSPTGGESPSPTPPEGQTPAATPPSNPPALQGEEVVTASGLRYIEIAEGSGDFPSSGDEVFVHYAGWLAESGSLIDSSFGQDPISFTIGADPPMVIAGWEEGLLSLREGGKRRLILPPELGYGDEFRPGVPANSTLIFDVELIEVREAGEHMDNPAGSG